MAEYTITRATNSVTINSYVDEQPGQYKLEADALNNILIIKAEDGGYKGELHTLVDTITVNGDVFSGTAAELKTLLLSDVFTVDGEPSPSTIILAAPDDSQWILGVNDSGALTTTELATPVAGAALTSVTLTSADGTEWEVTVTNAGALTTTEVV
jgi:hypothetical protein